MCTQISVGISLRIGDWLGLTHWGRLMHICVSKLTIIGSDNGLSPSRHQAIIWTNAGILLIIPLGTNFSEFLVEFLIFSFKKMRLKMSSAKRRPFYLGLNELIYMQDFPPTLNSIRLSSVLVRQDIQPGWVCWKTITTGSCFTESCYLS